jgi:hypothetical protein
LTASKQASGGLGIFIPVGTLGVWAAFWQDGNYKLHLKAN